jgi:lantibiotic leader peptide-processing serine protease
MARTRSQLVRRRLAIAVWLGALVVALGACGHMESAVPELDATVELASTGGGDQRYLVVAQPNARPRQVANAIAAAGGVIARELPGVGIYAAVSSHPRFLASISGNRAVAEAAPMPYVAVPDVVVSEAAKPSVDGLASPTAVPDPPAALWGSLWGIARVHAPAAWERGFTGSHDTVVAVIDTGIASNHPDVGPNIVYDACFTVAPDCIPYPSLSFHGTHVAGTVAANFGGGVVGVGPNLGLANYNVFELFEVEPGEFAVLASFDSVYAAMLDAAERGFEVINMSLGALVTFGPDQDNRMVAALRTSNQRVAGRVLRAGTVIVASAGNEAFDLTGPALNLPGGSSGILNVAATGIRPDPVYPQPGAYDVLAFYSNVGAPVDIAAPGGDCGLDDSCDPATRPANWFEYLVLSSFVDPNPTCAETESCPVGWAYAGGTSMAAPHVAGAAGLLRDAEPRLSPRQVGARLRQTAEQIGPRLAFGHGMVDADAAIP